MRPSVIGWLVGAAIVTIAAPARAGDVAPRPFGKVMGDGLGGPGELTTDPPVLEGAVCAPGETLFGIDVSYYQGNIDWNAVAADGVTFAIVRVSHSTQFFDPEFYDNLAGSRAAGIHTGVYQYFEPDEDPIAQADLMLDALGPLQPGDLPPMIDVESTGGLGPAAVANAVQAWIDHVEAALGVKPLIYTGHYFWNDNVASAAFGEYPLVLAWYNDCPGDVPIGWDMWTMHQYCDCGSVAGVSGNVDVDRFNGGLADLVVLAGEAECGDSMCTGAEDTFSCPADCPPCGVIGPDGGTIDNAEACYELHGNAEYWREEVAGQGGSLVWTHATDYDQAYNYAQWRFYLEESGRYDVSVHIESAFAESTQAAYVVSHAGGEQTVVIDQTAQSGWVSLGEYEFNAASDHGLYLGDNTGESVDSETMIVFDAVRLERLDGAPTPEPGGSSDDGGDSSDGGGGDDVPAGTSGPSGDDETSGGGEALPGQNAASDDGGCGCRADTGQPRGWAATAFAFVLLAATRRRRR